MTRRIDPGLIPPTPTLVFERALWKAGLSSVAGADEAGRGCLAGPVTAAVVILPYDELIADHLQEVRDSKQLTAEKRERVKSKVESFSLAWAVGEADNQEIDQLGIVPATRIAIWRALDRLHLKPDHILIDYLDLPDLSTPQTCLVKGDARSLSIAAASILAKTHRDSLMAVYATSFPGYGFETNMGYGTASHRQAIRALGPCSLHRMTFAPMREMDSD